MLEWTNWFYCIGTSTPGILGLVEERVRALNDAPVRPDRSYVLYWAQANRRAASNHALVYAITCANRLDMPVLVYEGVTCAYPHANDRLHTFMLQAVPETASALTRSGLGYCFYIRKRRSDAGDVAQRLAEEAALVVTDDYPTFLPARNNANVPQSLRVACHAVDASCVVPMNRFEKREYAAYTMRPKVHRLLPEYLHPLSAPAPKRRWTSHVPRFHVEVTADNIAGLVRDSEIDHSVPPSTCFTGGYGAARKRLDHFLSKNLKAYPAGRNEPSQHVTSNLSPYLHFGQISSLEVALKARDYGKKHKIGSDEFLEELIVRRELGFNFTRFATFDSLESLPDWARATLRKHARDARPVLFTRDQMEGAETYDELWNATQKELLLRGKIHGYYRMYWGKKIIEWSSSYEEALESMIAFHDKYALDGRDPNTYTSVLWCFGLHDRPWSERPIFGQVRYMSLEGMKRKTNVAAYIREIDHLQRTGQDLAKL